MEKEDLLRVKGVWTTDDFGWNSTIFSKSAGGLERTPVAGREVLMGWGRSRETMTFLVLKVRSRLPGSPGNPSVGTRTSIKIETDWRRVVVPRRVGRERTLYTPRNVWKKKRIKKKVDVCHYIDHINTCFRWIVRPTHVSSVWVNLTCGVAARPRPGSPTRGLRETTRRNKSRRVQYYYSGSVETVCHAYTTTGRSECHPEKDSAKSQGQSRWPDFYWCHCLFSFYCCCSFEFVVTFP